MTNEDKRAWLDWAVRIGFLKINTNEFVKIYENDIGWQVGGIDQEDDFFILPDLEFVIRDEIKKEFWRFSLNCQLGAAWLYNVRIFDAATSKLLADSLDQESVLEAFMEAFRESVEAVA